MKTSKIIIVVTCFFFFFYGAGQLSADAIYKKAIDQLLTTNVELEIDLKETKRNGKISEKRFNVVMSSFDDEEKVKTTILKPERAKGVTIVVTQFPNKLGLIEILTPANGKIRKLKATKKNLALVGSGSLFSEFTTKQPSDFTIKRLQDSSFKNNSCYVLDIIPKELIDNETAHIFVDKQNFNILQIKIFDVKGNTISTTKLDNFKKVGDKIHPEMITVKDNKTNKSSEIRVLRVTHRKNLTPDNFSLKSTLD